MASSKSWRNAGSDHGSIHCHRSAARTLTVTIRIKNWSKLQHFKDRTPPWIKLYRDILDDPDWHDLDGATSKVLIGLWLIASEDDLHQGRLPDTRKLAFRLRITEAQLNQALTKLSHWLVLDDINAISDGNHVDAPERETEEDRERDDVATKIVAPPAQKASRGSRLPDDWVLPADWQSWAEQERPDLDASAAACRFHDFWISKPGSSGVKLNWQATWRNWVRSERQAYGRPTQASSGTLAGAI